MENIKTKQIKLPAFDYTVGSEQSEKNAKTGYGMNIHPFFFILDLRKG